MRRAKASITKATYTKPLRVATEVKPESQSAFGLGAANCRFTRSRGQASARLLTVVFAGLLRMAPRSLVS